jgi:hypothetical protein
MPPNRGHSPATRKDCGLIVVTLRGRARIVTSGIGLAFAADPVFAGHLSTKEERRKNEGRGTVGDRRCALCARRFFPAIARRKRAAQRIERGEADGIPPQAHRSPILWQDELEDDVRSTSEAKAARASILA